MSATVVITYYDTNGKQKNQETKMGNLKKTNGHHGKDLGDCIEKCMIDHTDKPPKLRKKSKKKAKKK
jgi:hypothetical protein